MTCHFSPFANIHSCSKKRRGERVRQLRTAFPSLPQGTSQPWARVLCNFIFFSLPSYSKLNLWLISYILQNFTWKLSEWASKGSQKEEYTCNATLSQVQTLIYRKEPLCMNRFFSTHIFKQRKKSQENKMKQKTSTSIYLPHHFVLSS